MICSRCCLLGFLTLLLSPVFTYAAGPLGLDGSDVVFHRKGPDTLSRYGWQNVMSVGDINSDGFDDFAFTTARPNYNSLIFLGGNPPDTVEDYTVQGNIWAVGDFTGDGINEVVSSRVFNEAVAPQGIIYFYRGFGDSLARQPYDSLWSPSYNAGKGEVVRAAYVDGDTLADLLVCQPHLLNGPKVHFYSGGVALDTVPEWSVQAPGRYSHYLFWTGNFGFLDWNGDDQQDIYVGWHADLDSTSFVAIYFGPNFAALPDLILGTPADSGIDDPESFATFVGTVEDIDGDNFADLAVRSYNRILIYAGGPQADTLFDYMAEQRCSRAVPAGDVNGDKTNDLLLGISHRSAQGGIEILLGGPEWDEASDGWLVRGMLPPYFLDAIGYRVASAGDVNNDGYADLLFSTFNLTNDYVGDVFVALGGADIVTGVPDKKKPTLPELRLSVYPNPSNPQATISFSLPKAQTGRLELYNLLGQQVATLLPETHLSAGEHTVNWNGQLQGGTPAPTGLYFCRLTLGAASATAKLLLVK